MTHQIATPEWTAGPLLRETSGGVSPQKGEKSAQEPRKDSTIKLQALHFLRFS
jgi:hypothetical protein